jgi:hypothetical protein
LACAAIDLRRYRLSRFERGTAAGLTAMALKNQTVWRAVMAKDKNAFDEGKDFTADDLEEFLSPKFLSASAVGTRRLRRTSAGVKKLKLRSDNSGGTELKPVLHFSDSSELLPLNKTNSRTLKAELGDPSAWAGAVIEIFTDPTVIFDGKPALRVKVLKARAPGPICPGSDDDIPF